MIRNIPTTLRLVFIVVLACPFVTACSTGKTILELKDTQFYSAVQTGQSPATIQLSGLALHSSLAVGNISSTENGDTTQILINLVPARAGLSGRFEYTYVVPHHVNTVTYGRENTPIWNRADGFVQQKSDLD
ncbi:MAG: hypothetical protein KJ017_10325 [Alphaproteobacteria bacterium]|nr:hypothetical protein [Alphaproteobacteria bacterium]